MRATGSSSSRRPRTRRARPGRGRPGLPAPGPSDAGGAVGPRRRMARPVGWQADSRERPAVPSLPNPPERRATPGLRVLRAADARRVPWRNGRGVTEELALAPPGASFERGDFDWRVARATVAQAGPFSAFPGFERVLVVVQGAGLRLEHGA
ncbi:MAG: hypothetical protein FJ296_10095, partial [Planctomycetes bacterium]|nr:hypothetical protein [Planctomycetota bacterium]